MRWRRGSAHDARAGSLRSARSRWCLGRGTARGRRRLRACRPRRSTRSAIEIANSSGTDGRWRSRSSVRRSRGRRCRGRSAGCRRDGLCRSWRSFWSLWSCSCNCWRRCRRRRRGRRGLRSLRLRSLRRGRRDGRGGLSSRLNGSRGRWLRSRWWFRRRRRGGRWTSRLGLAARGLCVQHANAAGYRRHMRRWRLGRRCHGGSPAAAASLEQLHDRVALGGV